MNLSLHNKDNNKQLYSCLSRMQPSSIILLQVDLLWTSHNFFLSNPLFLNQFVLSMCLLFVGIKYTIYIFYIQKYLPPSRLELPKFQWEFDLVSQWFLGVTCHWCGFLWRLDGIKQRIRSGLALIALGRGTRQEQLDQAPKH